MIHTVSITPHSQDSAFTLSCSCGKISEVNAYKWVVLAAQRHYVDLGLTREGRGLVVDTIAGNGLGR